MPSCSAAPDLSPVRHGLVGCLSKKAITQLRRRGASDGVIGEVNVALDRFGKGTLSDILTCARIEKYQLSDEALELIGRCLGMQGEAGAISAAVNGYCGKRGFEAEAASTAPARPQPPAKRTKLQQPTAQRAPKPIMPSSRQSQPFL